MYAEQFVINDHKFDLVTWFLVTLHQFVFWTEHNV
jgi:hypothetical protein